MAEQLPMQDVGPDYMPKAEKPTAAVSTSVSYDNVHILPQTPQLIALMTYVLYGYFIFLFNFLQQFKRRRKKWKKGGVFYFFFPR